MRMLCDGIKVKNGVTVHPVMLHCVHVESSPVLLVVSGFVCGRAVLGTLCSGFELKHRKAGRRDCSFRLYTAM